MLMQCRLNNQGIPKHQIFSPKEKKLKTNESRKTKKLNISKVFRGSWLSCLIYIQHWLWSHVFGWTKFLLVLLIKLFGMFSWLYRESNWWKLNPWNSTVSGILNFFTVTERFFSANVKNGFLGRMGCGFLSSGSCPNFIHKPSSLSSDTPI